MSDLSKFRTFASCDRHFHFHFLSFIFFDRKTSPLSRITAFS
jgi:hypothetical protein